MPTPQHPPFDLDASLEVLAGIGENRRFDEVIDDEAYEDIQVICERCAQTSTFPSPAADSALATDIYSKGTGPNGLAYREKESLLCY